MSFDSILSFERQLAHHTGAPFAIMTDCCTHAIELCLRYDIVQSCSFSAFTYLSVPMTMHKLGISYFLTDEKWAGEYQLHGSRIWDSARRLQKDMYRTGMIQCLSFGHDKPLSIGRGGAILLDDREAYEDLLMMRYDGRDLSVHPWPKQKVFRVGYHYRPTLEEAVAASIRLPFIDEVPVAKEYPDLREIQIIG